MNQKLSELTKTLMQSGIAASESEAKRMAESMISTETKVQNSFDEKKDEETRYGDSPRTPIKNPVDGSPINTEFKPFKPEIEVSKSEDELEEILPVQEEINKEENKNNKEIETNSVGEVKQELTSTSNTMSPEEYSAQRLDIDKDTSKLVNEEKEFEEKVEKPVQESKELPELNPLEDSVKDSGLVNNQLKEEKNQDTVQEIRKEEVTHQNVGSDGKPLPQTHTPERPEMSEEEKIKMEESKVDLTKIFGSK